MKRVLIAFIMLMTSLSASAWSTYSGVPTTWRITFTPGQPDVSLAIVVAGAGTSCTNGRLNFDNFTLDDVKYFLSLVEAARVAGFPIFVNYDATSCVILNYGLAAQAQ